jgi:hypothetical protein
VDAQQAASLSVQVAHGLAERLAFVIDEPEFEHWPKQ